MQPGKFMDDPPVKPAITNTFQAMLAWDSSRTFACFFYPTGGIQWAQAATMMGPAAVVRVRPLRTPRCGRHERFNELRINYSGS
jgi:Nidogen-like